MPKDPYWETNLIRRNLRNRRTVDQLNPYMVDQVAKLPEVFEAEVNARLDRLQEELHTLKR